MTTDHLEIFLWRVNQHRQVSALHRSICLELVQLSLFLGPSFHIDHDELRQAARIGSRTSYFRSLKQLHAWRLIEYTTRRQGKLHSSNWVNLTPAARSVGAPAPLSTNSGTERAGRA